MDTQAKRYIMARLSDGTREVVYQIDIFSENISCEYNKDGFDYESFERNGVTYHIIRNKKLWTAVWIIDNIECTITVDCQEDEFYYILESIYTMEGLNI